MLSSLVTFTGEIAYTKVVLHKEKKKKKKLNKQEESCLAVSCYGNGSRKFTFSFRSDCYHT